MSRLPWQASGGALPGDQMIVHGSGALATGSDADSVYILQRVSVVAGSEFRSADPGTDQNTGERNRSVHADQRGRRQVLRVHQRECGPQHGRRAGRPGS